MDSHANATQDVANIILVICSKDFNHTHKYGLAGPMVLYHSLLFTYFTFNRNT